MKSTTTRKEMNFTKAGIVVPAGTTLNVSFDSARPTRCFFSYGGRDGFTLPLEAAHKYLTGFSKCPGINTLEKYSNNGVCPTPTGHKVEPDGFGPDGSPSWLLVVGVI